MKDRPEGSIESREKIWRNLKRWVGFHIHVHGVREESAKMRRKEQVTGALRVLAQIVRDPAECLDSHARSPTQLDLLLRSHLLSDACFQHSLSRLILDRRQFPDRRQSHDCTSLSCQVSDFGL